MKKNISINISGIIFHIEEDGYETLRKYLDSVNRYFGSFDDSSEILADIEGRIAEIFLSKLNDGKQVITAEDVSSLIATMGSVNDFKAAEEQEFAGGEPARESQQQRASSSSSSSATSDLNRKLQRDDRRKILGGVCAGFGHYFSIDPVWPRLLLALLVIGSGGIAFIFYIVLWIFLPVSAELEEESTIKKMYRHPDKKVVGGVAAGIAAFFNADITLIRVLFILLAIFGGSGILLYIVLWIVLPEAKTITEKMEMQGEKVTLSNIESTVKKEKTERAEEESTLTKIVLFPFRAIGAVLNALGQALVPILRVFVDVLRVAIGLCIALTGFFLVIAILVSGGILFGMFATPWFVSFPDVPLEAFRNSFPTWTMIFAFLAAIIPSMFVLLLGTSVIAKRMIIRPVVGWTMFVLFFVSVAAISFGIPNILFGFKEEGEYKVEQSFPVSTGTVVFNMREVGLDDYDVTSLSLKGYEGKEIKLVERFQSQGRSRKEAGENAQMVTYSVTQADSIFTFDSNITFKPDARFHAQSLDVDVYVPYNQTVRIDASLWRIVDTNIISGNNYRYLNQDTEIWRMTEKGLECASCPAREEDKDEAIGANDEFGLRDFNSLDVQGLFNVRVEKGDEYAVEMDGPESERKRYNVYVSGETLVIDYDDNNKFFWKKNLLSDREMKITITMPELRELDMMGAGKVRFSGFDEDEMDIKLTGAIMADGDIHADNLQIDLTGASMLDLSGNGRFMKADIVGASGLRAYGYEVARCIVEAPGASSAKVNVTETLEIDKGIASSVSHKGNPEIIRR
ncbi:MAG: PspC domain-containing protein [Cyclobacteriaceae bacterium]|nr:PspC domain-containing protein [Cyclobacteriaceae bacterium]